MFVWPLEGPSATLMKLRRGVLVWIWVEVWRPVHVSAEFPSCADPEPFLGPFWL